MPYGSGPLPTARHVPALLLASRASHSVLSLARRDVTSAGGHRWSQVILTGNAEDA